MKLQHHGEAVEVMGAAPSGKIGFQIKTSALAFKILSEGLYSDKIKAVIRELCTNAFDAHVEAGKRDVPFEVHFPTRYEPWFSVKDQGVGMSHDRVMKNYCTYFGSSKNDTNEQVGCLGLGSKSPFAYTETFSVTSIKDGKKRTYTALVSEEGYPEVMEIPLAEEDGAPIFEMDTDEHDGVLVTFPVKDQHVQEFTSKAKVVFLDFPVKPKTNIELYMGKIEYSIDKPTWGMRKNNNDLNWGTTIRVIQGCVGYPLDKNQIGFSHPLLDSPIDLRVQIGEVEITPSRESISYTAYTRENLKAALEVVAQEISDSYVEKLNSCKTRLEALITLSQIRSQNTNLWRAVENKVYTSPYDNFKLTSDHIEVDQCEFLPIMVKPLQVTHKGKLLGEYVFASKSDRQEMIAKAGTVKQLLQTVKFSFVSEPYLVFNDTKKTTNLRGIFERAKDGGEFGGRPIYLIEPSKDQELVDGEVVFTDDIEAQDYAELLANEFDSQLVLLSTIAAKHPAPKREKVNKKTTRIRQFWTNKRDNGSIWWRCTADNIENILTTNEGKVKYWVNLFDGKVNEDVRFTETVDAEGKTIRKSQNSLTDNQVLGVFWDHCKTLGMIEKGGVLLGVPERELSVVQADPDEWVNLIDLAREFMANLTAENTNLLLVNEHSSRFSNLRELSKVLTGTELKDAKITMDLSLFDGLMAAGKKVSDYYGSAKRVAESLGWLLRQYTNQVPPFPETIEKYIAEVKQNYPLLMEMIATNRTHAIAYIKLIEERDALLSQVASLQPQIFEAMEVDLVS